MQGRNPHPGYQRSTSGIGMPGAIPRANAPMAGAQARPKRERLTLLVGFMMFLTVVSYGRAHELFGPTVTLPVGKVLFPIGLLLLASQPDFRARLAGFRTAPGRSLGLFFCSLMISIPFSYWIGGSVFEFQNFIMAQVPYLILLVGVAASEQELEYLLRAVVISIILFGFVILTGGASYEQGRVVASSSYDSNDLAMVAAVSIPFALRMVLGKPIFWRLAGLAGIGSALLLILQAGSRGAMLAVAAIVMAYMFMFRRTISGGMKVLLIVSIIVAIALAPGVFLERLNSLGSVSQDYNVSDEVGRVEIWKRGMGYFLHRPLNGVGFGQFNAAEGRSGAELHGTGEGFKWSTAHNSFVLAAAELGLPGIIGFLGMFLPIFRMARRARRAARMDKSQLSLATQGEALAIAVVGFLVAGFFLSATYQPVSMTVAGFVIAYAAIAKRRGVLNANRLRQAPVPQR